MPTSSVELWNGRIVPILAPTWTLSDELSALMASSNPSMGGGWRAATVMDLVIRHGLGVGDMIATGGPLKWPDVVLTIVATWPDDGPWPHWSGFVRQCVSTYVEDWQAPVESADPDDMKVMMRAGLTRHLIDLDPRGLADRQANRGGDEASKWLASADAESLNPHAWDPRVFRAIRMAPGITAGDLLATINRDGGEIVSQSWLTKRLPLFIKAGMLIGGGSGSREGYRLP